MTDTDQGLLCNDLRHPDLWYTIYRRICENKLGSAKELLMAVDPENLARERWEGAFKALRIVGVLDNTLEQPSASRPSGLMKGVPHPMDELSFRLWCLSLTRALARKTAGAWDRQAHFALIYEHLLGGDAPYFRRDALSAKNISDFLRQESCPVELNVQKLTYWLMIASYLGLVVRVPGGGMTVIDPSLFSAGATRVRQTAGMGRIPLRDFVTVLSENLILIPLQRQGPYPVLPAVVSKAIWQAHRLGYVTLGTRGDRGHVQLRGISSDSQVFTDIEIKA